MTGGPIVTVAVPSFNQGRFLDEALKSIFAQELALEVYVADGGSTDSSVEVIRRWESRLAGWRSYPDRGQAAAINEAVAAGRAPFVCWVNSDDWLLPGGLHRLLDGLHGHPEAPVAYGRAWNVTDGMRSARPVWVEAFSERRLAQRCFICQPATLIRRPAWEAVQGVDESLHMAMDYDLWWRLLKKFGPLQFVDEFVAVNRDHAQTKTRSRRQQHYREAMDVVRRHNGRVPLKWWIAQPYSVWFRSRFG